MNEPHFRVAADPSNVGCSACGRGAYWTIVETDAGEEIGIGTSWADMQLAEDICELMNDARAGALSVDAACIAMATDLRAAVLTLRRSSKPLADLIPLLQRAADLLDTKGAAA